MAKMTKTKSEVLHAKMRARQRLGIEFNKEERRSLIARIQTGRLKTVRKQSLRVTVFRDTINGIDIDVVYDNKRHTVVTFMYPEESKMYIFKKEKHNETTDTIHEAR